MIKLIIFDLDGVLIDAKKIHYESLNDSLDDEFKISWDDHLLKYDGLKTLEKLLLLTKEKKLPNNLHNFIWEKKQRITLEKLEYTQESKRLIDCISKLNKDGYKLAVCSNSIRKTVLLVLSKLGIIKYFDLILSNEDVKNSKPYPEIYWNCMSYFSILPEETLILEDSPVGLLGANRSSANLMRIGNVIDVSYENILKEIGSNTPNILPKWKNNNLNVLIPMAGAGSRFEKAGYSFPKPLIDVNGTPMIQLVVNNLNISANFIFIIQKDHREKYNLDILLNLISPNCKIIEVDGVTDGAAVTTLLAKKYINNHHPLLIANSDQFIVWNSNEFMYKMCESGFDGGILTFESTHPKWSFAKLDKNDFIIEVAEKKPISNNATVGIYYWGKGSDYVMFAEQMIQKEIKTNGEYYVCPVYNEAILNGKKIKNFKIEKMWGLGTPEDLKNFLKENNYSDE